ncbi:MAG: 23S rRNA (adenine(2503)-C(2))-methyltransferase RlmN [Thermoanaerobaculia bacterium]
MNGAAEPLGFSRSRWEAWMSERGFPAFHGRQVFDALHRRGVRKYEAMREIPGTLRVRLSAEMPLRLPEIVRREESRDGSVKYGLRMGDGNLIEAVFMPGELAVAAVNEFEDARAVAGPATGPPRVVRTGATPPGQSFTVCLSSQTGCAVDCVFCVTGRLGGGRNLSAGEILGQLYAVLDDAGRSPEGLRVVFMGMGEPLLNPEAVLAALEVLFEIVSPRRVTVSTSGITPVIGRFAALPRRPNLAVSINAADEETRTRLMPINRTYPLAGLLRAMRAWPADSRRPITAEYVLMAGVNDSAADARRLAGLVRGLPVKVNVIPLNEDPMYLPGWKRPAEETIDTFVRALASGGVRVTVRRSKGPDAQAACGQLKGRTADPRRRAGSAAPAPPATGSRPV